MQRRPRQRRVRPHQVERFNRQGQDLRGQNKQTYRQMQRLHRQMQAEYVKCALAECVEGGEWKVRVRVTARGNLRI